MLFVEQNMLQ